MLSRRELIAAGLAAFGVPFVSPAGRAGRTQRRDLVAACASIERRVAGRLGVAMLDTDTGRHFRFQGDARFPMCSTFKLLLAANVLSRVDHRQEDLARFVPYGERDLLEYAPVTRAHVKEGGLTVEALAAAAVEVSDNTAANLLIKAVGGLRSFNRYIASMGDRVTRLDRMEPDLNSAIPGDRRDTTTPDAMLSDMQRILIGNALSRASRERLLQWLVAGTTGTGRLRAGMPTDWRVGDKTGAGAHGSTNDLVIAWPPGRGPILIAAYLADTAASANDRDAALAAVGRLATTMHR